MSLLERTTAFLVDRVAPKLIFGKLRDEAALADLERQAREEIEARISLGRPGPEEYLPRVPRPTAGRPDPPAPRRPTVPDTPAPRRPTVPVDVHVVTLGAIAPAVAPVRVVDVPLSERPA